MYYNNKPIESSFIFALFSPANPASLRNSATLRNRGNWAFRMMSIGSNSFIPPKFKFSKGVFHQYFVILTLMKI